MKQLLTFALSIWMAITVAANPLVLLSGNGPNGGGGSATVATDDFSWATDPVSISTDSDWTVTLGAILATSSLAQGNFAGDTSVAHFNSVAASVNQRVELTIKAGVGSGYVGVACRVVDNANYWYAISNGTIVFFGVVVAGTPTNFVNGSAIAFSTDDKIAMEITGTGASTIVTVQRNTGGTWTTVYSGDPGTYMNTAGKGGICTFGEGGQGDDFTWINLP